MARFEMGTQLQGKTKQAEGDNLQQNYSRFVLKQGILWICNLSNKHDDDNANINLGATCRKLSSKKYQPNIIQSFSGLQIF